MLSFQKLDADQTVRIAAVAVAVAVKDHVNVNDELGARKVIRSM